MHLEQIRIILSGGITQIGAIWFLWALFWAEIIAKVALELKWEGKISLIVLVLVAYYTSLYVWLPLNIQAGIVASIFVYFGALLRERQVLEILDWKFFFIGFIVLVLEVYFGIYLHVVSNTYGYGMVSMIGAILISDFIIEVSKYIDKISVFKRILLFYGQNTKIILCFHLIELNNIPWYRLYNKMQILEIPMRIQSICVFCLKLILITLCTYIVLKIRWLRKVFVKD